MRCFEPYIVPWQAWTSIVMRPLAEGVVRRKWYPCDAKLVVIGQCWCGVFFSPPTPNFLSDGAGCTQDDVYNGSPNKDIVFGTGNWKPDWDPGFQS